MPVKTGSLAEIRVISNKPSPLPNLGDLLGEVGTNVKVQAAFEKSLLIPGQGGLLEQLDKRLRKEQRTILYEILERLNRDYENLLTECPIVLEKIIPQRGKQSPIQLRFCLPTWCGYDKVFWHALCDYVILALHRVRDIDIDKKRGKITVQYFAKEYARKEKVKTPEMIGFIIQQLAFLVDREILTTDFTLFRRMSERGESLGAMGKLEALGFSTLLKLL